MTGFPLTQPASLEIVLATTSGQRTLQAVAATPGWYVVDEFPLARSVSAGLDVLGLVSAAGLTMRVRLFDVTTASVVGGVGVTITATAATRAQSARAALTGGRVYQLQAEVTGGTGDGNFGVLQQAALSN